MTIYVSVNGTKNATGSNNDPLASINAAILHAQGKGVKEVAIMEGTYNERIAPQNVTGVSVRAAEGADSVTIDGGYKLPTGTPVTSGGSKYRSDEKFPIYGGGSYQGKGFVWGGMLQPKHCEGMTFQNITFTNSRGRGIVNERSDDMRYIGCKVEGVRNAGFWSIGDNVHIENSSFIGMGNFAETYRDPHDMNWPVLVHIRGGGNVHFVGCTIGEGHGEGFACSGGVSDVTFERGMIYDCHAMLWYSHWGQKVTLKDSLLYQTASTKYLRGPDKYPSCVVFNMESKNFADYEESDHHTIDGCLILNRGNGIDFWGNQGGGKRSGAITVTNTTICGLGPSFHSLTDGSVHTDTRITDNIAYRMAAGDVWEGYALDHNATITGNVTSTPLPSGTGNTVKTPQLANPSREIAAGVVPNWNDYRVVEAAEPVNELAVLMSIDEKLGKLLAMIEQ